MQNSRSSLAALTLGAIGVVYGDIGTSVLYAIKEVFGSGHVAFTHGNVYGILSIFFWSLTVIVSIKYVLLVLRADNNGEGGLVAMLALASQAVSRRIGFDSQSPGDRLVLAQLRELNEAYAYLGVLSTAEGIHPLTAYLELARLIGTLAILDVQTRRPPALPARVVHEGQRDQRVVRSIVRLDGTLRVLRGSIDARRIVRAEVTMEVGEQAERRIVLQREIAGRLQRGEEHRVAPLQPILA